MSASTKLQAHGPTLVLGPPQLAAPTLLAVARVRVPAADVREGDLEAVPFADASFEAVTAVNSIFYAEDMAAAARELARVVRSGGRVVILRPFATARASSSRRRSSARSGESSVDAAQHDGRCTRARAGADRSWDRAGCHLSDDASPAMPPDGFVVITEQNPRLRLCRWNVHGSTSRSGTCTAMQVPWPSIDCIRL